MKYTHLLISALIVAGCGGGGSGGSTQPAGQQAAQTAGLTCVVSQSPSIDRYRVALVDIPRDHGSFTADGINATGLANVARQLDQIKCVGFDTVAFQTFIPIDPATGLLKEYDPAGLPGDQDKRLPPDYWRWVDYAKSIGLRVVLQAVPADYRTDQQLWSQPYPDLPVNTMLNTVRTYYVNMAREAQRRSIEAMHTGYFQMGFDTAAYAARWQEVITAVRAVYTGKLVYATCHQCTSNAVWNMVDIVSVSIKPSVKAGCEASVGQIRAGYGDSAQRLASIKAAYNKPIWIDQINIDLVGCQLPTGTESVYQMLFNNQSINFTVSAKDYQWQANSFRAVFDLLASDWSASVSGMTVGTYLPWTEAAWIQNPQSYTQWLYKKYDQMGSSLYRNSNILTTLQAHLSRPWHHRFVY